jgi:methionyl-tRNA formyltransferase
MTASLHATNPDAGPPARRAVFVGDRPLVFEAALEFPELEIVRTWAVAGSALERRLLELGRAVESFGPGDGRRLVEQLEATPFDLLISNGCPIILPVGRLARPGRLFLNVHPSPLPDMRGKHPLNGALLFETGVAGATLHHMTDAIDDGPIVARGTLPITDDLDLALLYHLVFRLEAQVFRDGMRRLVDASFDLPGEPQGPGRYYSGREKDRVLDPAAMADVEILRRVRAFGVRTQGATCELDGRPFHVFEARVVGNPALLAEYGDLAPGAIALAIDGRLLVRTRQGLISVVASED